MKKAIETARAPAAIGPYSQAIQTGTTVYLSGQIPLDPTTMNLVSSEFKLQAEQVFKNLRAVCEGSGSNLDGIVKLTIYLIDLAMFPIVNTIMQQFFTSPYPARVTIQVS